MMIRSLIFSAVLIAVLSACSPSSSGGGGPAVPVAGNDDPAVITSHFGDYENYHTQTLRLQSEYGCSAFRDQCPAQNYPKLKSQVADMKKVLELGRKAMLKRQTAFLMGDDLDFYAKKTAELEKELASIEQRLPAVKKRLAEKEAERAKLAEELERKGCRVTDRNTWVVNCPNLDSVEAFEIWGAAIPVTEKIAQNLRATEAEYASVKMDSAVADSSKGNLRSFNSSWYYSCVHSAGVLLPPAVKAVAEAAGLKFDDRSPWLNAQSECGDFSVTKEKLKQIRRFHEAIVAAQPAARAAAMDLLVLTFPGDEKDGFSRYDAKEAYNHHPDSGDALKVRVPLRAKREELEDFFNGLDRAGNAKWKARAAKLQSIQDQLARFPMTVDNGPIHLLVEVDRGKMDAVLRYSKIDAFQTGLDEAIDLVVESTRRENEYIRKHASGDYDFPNGQVSVRVILGPRLSCPESPNRGDAWLITGSVDSWDRSNLSLCANYHVLKFYKRK